MRTFILFLLYFFGNADNSYLRSKIINNIKNSADIRPFANTTEPVIIEPQLKVIHLYGVNFEDQTYTLTGYFRQTWYDSRLKFNANETTAKYLLFTKNDGIWIPDTFFSNSISHRDRSSNGNDNNRAYHYLRVWPDGKVLYSQMIDLKLNAFLELKYYPYHITLPIIVLESYSYSANELKFSLTDKFDALKFEERTLNTPAYQIYTDRSMSSDNIATYDTGKFSIINYSFKLIPTRVQNLLSILVPVTLLILANGISFWFPVYKMFTNRIAIGMTSLLADFALSFSLPIPNSKQFMWVDIYLLMSYLYISLSILWSYLENKYVKDINIKKPEKKKKNKVIHVDDKKMIEDLAKEVVDDAVNVVIDKGQFSSQHVYGDVRSIILEKYSKKNDNYDKKELEKYIDEIMNDSQSTSELLTQPYLGKWRSSIRWIYMLSWIGINVLILTFGEYYIHINPSLKMRC
jgi:hypothetical protein